MARPRLPDSKRRWITFRCTDQERIWWARLAETRDKTIHAMIRDGLAKLVNTTCLCKPGMPICPKCNAKAT